MFVEITEPLILVIVSQNFHFIAMPTETQLLQQKSFNFIKCWQLFDKVNKKYTVANMKRQHRRSDDRKGNEHFYVFASRKFVKRPLQWKESFIYFISFSTSSFFPRLRDAKFNAISFNLMKCDDSVCSAHTYTHIRHSCRQYWQWNSVTQCWLPEIVSKRAYFKRSLLQITHVQSIVPSVVVVVIYL